MTDDARLPDTDATFLDRLSRFGGGKLLGDMIALYLANAPERLAAALAATASGDAKAAELALHSLKSSSAQLGALRMQRLCEQGETLAKAGDLTEVAPLLQQIADELPRIGDWLEGARQKGVG